MHWRCVGLCRLLGQDCINRIFYIGCTLHTLKTAKHLVGTSQETVCELLCAVQVFGKMVTCKQHICPTLVMVMHLQDMHNT